MTISRPASSGARYATTGGRRSEPDAGAKASGTLEGQRIPARILNWLLDAPLERLAYLEQFTTSSDEIVYPASKSRVVVVNGAALRTFLGAAVDSGFIGNWSPLSVIPGSMTSVNQLTGIMALEAPPSGCVLQSVTFYYNTTHVSTAAMDFKIWKANADGSSPTQIGATVHSHLTAGSGSVSVAGLVEEIDRSAFIYWLTVSATDSASSGGDHFYSAELHFDDPGPRNF